MNVGLFLQGVELLILGILYFFDSYWTIVVFSVIARAIGGFVTLSTYSREPPCL